MSLVGNEQAKLTANYLNGVAIAVFAVGSLGSLIPALATDGSPTVFSVTISGVCFVLSLALHLIARRVLQRLVP